MGQRRTLDDGWSVWLDHAAEWRDTPLDRLDRLPESPPSAGWDVLERGVPVELPATTLDIDGEHRGVSWWSREIDVTEAGPVVLRFGGVRLLCEVFWDRRRVAVDLEGYTPFETRIPAAPAGRHRLDLRVTNPGGIHSWDDVRPVEWGRFQLPSSHDFGGPWQPVTLHEAAKVRIADVWVRPDRELRAALVDVEVEAPAPQQLLVEILSPEGATVGTHECLAAPGVTQVRIAVPDALLYMPGSPHRYRCRVVIGKGRDALEQPFGFRQLDYADGTLRLNGEKLRLTSAISWGWYRRGPVPSPGDVDREAASVAAFGMNTLTAHRFPSTPGLQDALEERGLLLYQEPGGVGGPMFVSAREDQRPFVTSLMARRARRLARRDRSRACLVWWNVGNEWRTVDMQSWPAYVDAVPKALRAEDDSRLTTFTSGWGVTPMWRPHEAEAAQSWDYHRIFTWPNVWSDAIDWEVGVAVPPRPMLAIDGESACFTSLGRLRDAAASFPDDAPEQSAGWHWRRWVQRLEEDLSVADPHGRLGGLDGLTAGTAAVQGHGFARLIESHRRQEWLHGITLNGWHQHHKVGTSAIVAPDRTPAIDPEPIRRANAPRALAFRQLPRVMERGHRQEIVVEVLGPDGSQGRVAATLALTRHGETDWEGPADGELTPRTAGVHDIEARWQDLHVSDRVLVVDPPDVEGVEIALVDSYGELGGWLTRAGVRVRPWRFHEPGPVLVVAEHGAAIHEYTHAAGGRLAILAGRKPFGSVTMGFEVAGADELPSGPGSADAALQGGHIGGWAFSLTADELPNLGTPGVWGAERAPLFASRGVRRPEGRWLTGFCTFPDADIFDVRMPGLAATTWVSERDGGSEVLTSYLPVVERRDHPLGRAALLDLVCWLAG